MSDRHIVIDTSALHSAGTGPPVPAESSVEVDRIRRRFTELSVRAAEEAAGLVRRLLDELAEQLAQPSVPDLGPAVIPDQLAVLVFDIYAAGGGSDLTERLTALRRSLP